MLPLNYCKQNKLIYLKQLIYWKTQEGYRVNLIRLNPQLLLATKWGSSTQFETTRARKIKQHFDELRKTLDSLLQKANFRSTFLLTVSILSYSTFPKDSPVYMELQKYLRQFSPTHC